MAALGSLRASAESSVVLTPAVGQSLGLAGVTSGSGIRATSVLIFHKTTSR